MKNLTKIIGLVVFGALLLNSCGTDRTREEKAAAIINEIDAPFVVINTTPQNLMDKSGVMDGVLPFTYELILEFFIDESVTGIDYDVKSQIIVGNGESFTPNFYGIFKVKDDKLFKDLLDKEANADLGEKDGFNYAIKEDENYCVVWNEEFAIISNIPMDFASMLSGGGSNQGMSMVESNLAMIQAAEEGEMDETYLAFIEKEDDLGFYYDGDAMMTYLESMEMMKENEDFDKMKEMYEGMAYEMYINFNDGSVDFEFESHLSDKVKEELNFIADDGVDSRLLSYGKSPNPVVVGSYNIKFTEFFNYFEDNLSERDFEEMEDGLSEVGLSVKDAKNAMTGQVVFVLDRIETTQKTMDFGYGDPYTYTSTDPIFGLVAGVKDKKVIEKALNSLQKETVAAEDMLAADMDVDEMMDMMASYGGPSIETFDNGVICIDNEGYIFLETATMFVTNDSSWAMAVADGKGKKIKDPKGDLAKYPMAFYGNFASLAKMENLDEAKPIVDMFTEFHGGGNMDGGSFHLIMKDKKKNALRVLTEMIADELNKMEQRSNPDLYEELESATEAAEECEGGACEAGACEAGACEGGE